MYSFYYVATGLKDADFVFAFSFVGEGDCTYRYPSLLYISGFFFLSHLHKLVVYIIKLQTTESKPIF